jgi:molybdopterin-guanine dinucleotide biosynthesis protein A
MVGVILAGGAGTRMGGAKATRELAGRPLAAYPADALSAVVERVAIAGKRDEQLPALAGVEGWNGEPSETRHPAAGIAYALERAGDAVLVVAADMPFVTPAECRALHDAASRQGAGRVVAAEAAGGVEPLLGIYPPRAAGTLRSGALAGESMRSLVERLDRVLVDLPRAALRSVNTPAELAAADAELRQVRSIR